MLQEIIAHKRQEVEERQRADGGRSSTENLKAIRERAESAGAPRPWRAKGDLSLIAEVKRRSPSKGDLSPELDPVERALSYERGGASAISVLTDHVYFRGTFDDLAAVRGAVQLPVLCKDFILSPYQVYEARAWGADLLLLIVAALDDKELGELYGLAQELGMLPLVEVHDQHELARAIAIGVQCIGINNRDLADFSVDLITTEYLAPLVPDDILVVSESGIANRADVERVAAAGAQVILVGEALVLSPDPQALIRDLLG